MRKTISCYSHTSAVIQGGGGGAKGAPALDRPLSLPTWAVADPGCGEQGGGEFLYGLNEIPSLKS